MPKTNFDVNKQVDNPLLFRLTENKLHYKIAKNKNNQIFIKLRFVCFNQKKINEFPSIKLLVRDCKATVNFVDNHELDQAWLF